MAILKLKSISQEFGGLRALDNLNIEVQAHDIYGIIGPNGAGKTTLFNIISGLYIPSEGDLIFKEQRINNLPAHDIAKLGIARTFQNIRLFNKLSVLDNVKIGCHGITKSGFFSSMLGLPGSRREENYILNRSEEMLVMVSLQDKKYEYAANLSYGEQRRLEIARALALNPTLLLLDEPAAGMNLNEKEELMELIRLIRKEMDITILLVEHDMHLVMNICEKIAVLNYGRKIAEGSSTEIKNNQNVIESYLGVGA